MLQSYKFELSLLPKRIKIKKEPWQYRKGLHIISGLVRHNR